VRRPSIIIAELAVQLLLNVTAGLIDRAWAIKWTRWGWMAVALHITYLIISSEKGKRCGIRLRAWFGDRVLASYIFVVCSCVLVGIVYWAGINTAYARMFATAPQPSKSVEKQPPPRDAASVSEPTKNPPTAEEIAEALAKRGINGPSTPIGVHERVQVEVHRADAKTTAPDYSNGLEFQATVIPGPGEYPEGTEIAGIKWRKEFTDVRVTISNILDVPVEKLDLLVGFDIHIAGMGQLGTAVQGVSASPGNASVDVISLKGLDPDGKPMQIPAVPAGPGFVPVYHIMCQRLSARGQIKLVVATIALNSFAGGMPAKLFADKRPPKLIRIGGSYETGPVDGAKRYPSRYVQEFIK
jgi:hypothetical protein